MAAVSEWIVREYFEALGFLVHQPRKYAVASRPKRPEEEVDLLVINPKAKEQRIPDSMLWTSSDVKRIARAIVSVRGWHTDRFSPAMLDLTPELFRFTEDESVKKAADILDAGPITKILCLPGLSASTTLKKRSLEILKEKGVDGVLSFPTMLYDVISKIETSKNYEKSDLLQILRILKNYNMIKDEQMELFQRKRRSKHHDDE